MTIIAEKDRPLVRDLLARERVEDVEIVFFTAGRSGPFVSGRLNGQSSEETREPLEELVGLSDQLLLTTRDVDAEPAAATLYNVIAVPTVIVRRRASATTPATPRCSSHRPVRTVSAPPLWPVSWRWRTR